MKHIAILLLLSIFTGCASISVTPPEKKNFKTSRVYNKSYEVVWLRAVDWFADHNVVIEKIEKESGLLTAKYRIDVSTSDYLDFGKLKVSGTHNGYDIEKTGSLNVTVRKIDASKTKASVNFFGEFELHAQDAWDGRYIKRTGTAVSTGKLEANILNYIGQ